MFARLNFSRISRLNGNSRKKVPAKIYPLYTHTCTKRTCTSYVYALRWRLNRYRYFSPSDSASLPSPKGLVSTTLSSAAIRCQRHIMWAWHLGCLFAKSKIAKISLWHHFRRFTKLICTCENFPVYGILSKDISISNILQSHARLHAG